MGQTGFFIRDNANINLFPGTILQYNNEIRTELRIKDNETRFSGNVLLPLSTTNYVVGVGINRPIIPADPLGVAQNTSLMQATDIWFGMPLMGNDLGIRVSYAADSYQQDQPDIEESARYIEVAGGLSSDKYDLGVNLYFPGIDYESENFNDEWSSFGVGVNGRYLYKPSKKVEYVPVVLFAYNSGSGDRDPGGGAPVQSVDYSAIGLTLAAALNYYVNDDNLIILGIQPYSFVSSTIESQGFGKETQSFTIFPAIHLGAETRIASWLFGRVGIFQAFQTTTTTNEPEGGEKTETSSSISSLNFSFGIGIELGRFVIDFDINDDMFFEGPYILGGQPLDPFNRVSVSYNFGE